MPSLLEAIDAKYGDDKELCSVDLPIAIYVPRKSPRCCIPSLLVLNDCAIDSAGNSEELQDKCQRVEELDLAQNNLQSWTEILNILSQMPRLKFANLSFNALRDCLDGIDMKDFPYLKMLVLNSTNIDWASVRQLLTRLPSLEELHLSKNEFQQIELDESFNCDKSNSSFEHSNLKRLHFTDNPISEWCEVCKLGRAFPQLESLVLAHCPVNTLDTTNPSSSPSSYSRTESECEGSSPRDSSHDSFRQLRVLNLNSTLISSWDDVERLGKFPALENLRIRNCPLFEYPMEYTEHERRQLLIARLPNIQTLNGGGAITGEEREDAERAFIRYYMDKPESDRPERYADLVAIHGKLDPLVDIDLTPERRVKVIVTCPQENLTEEKCLKVYQTVLELKQKLEQFCKIPANKMRLFYVDQDLKAITGPEEMIYPNKQLYSYNISSGDEIIISAKLGKSTSLK